MFRTKSPSQLETAIARAFAQLESHEVGSDEYSATLEHISKLHKMREDEKSHRVSADTAAVIGANLAGILLILRHEHVNVITSRAMNLVMKPR